MTVFNIYFYKGLNLFTEIKICQGTLKRCAISEIYKLRMNTFLGIQ